jgi:hypothetical protein
MSAVTLPVTNDIHTVLVISPGDQVVFAYETDGPTATPPRFEDIDPRLQRLVAVARAASPHEPQVTGFIRHHGHAYVASASVINWYDEDRKIPFDTASVLVFARDFQPELIDEIVESYELPGLRFAYTDDHRDGELLATLPAFGSGEAIGFLVWRPDLPGKAFLRASRHPSARPSA